MMHFPVCRWCDLKLLLLAWSGALVLLASPPHAHAQVINSETIPGQSAAQAISQANTAPIYNFQLGPVQLRTDASVTSSYNDNINLSHIARTSDYIFDPEVDFHALWQVTELNSLTANLGIGYEAYLQHSGASGLTISPDSKLELKLYVGDVSLSLHDIFSYSEDPVGVGQLSNISQFTRFQNVVGVNADWNFGDLDLLVGYDHTNFFVFQTAYNYLDFNEETFSPQVSFTISPTIKAGLSGSYSYTGYNKNIENNNYALSLGPFVSAQLTENISVNAQAGWYYAIYDRGGLNGDSDNIDSYSASLGISHRVNAYINQSLTAGEGYIPGLTSNFTQRTFVNYQLSWLATAYLNLSTNLFYENLDDSDATFRQTSNRYGAQINLGYALTDHLSSTLGYQYLLKDSDQPDLGYYQDTVSLSLRYGF